MKVLFFIESLRSSGKERRLTELIKGLTKYPEIECELVITRRDVHYTDIFNTGVKIHYLERKIKKDPTLFWKFYRICKDFQADIIHVWGNMVAIYAIPAKVLLKIPMINNQITNAFGRNKELRTTTRFIFPFSDLIVANSKAGLGSYNAPEKKSHCIYNGFDLQRLKNISKTSDDIRTSLAIKTKYIVGMIASFVESKDYGSYIQAAQMILDHRKDATFLCIGGRDSTPYEEMVRQTYTDFIKFPGRQTVIEPIINACDIGVLSTFIEGIPNSVIEFMAFGKPVVATDGGGTKELIVDNETGFLIPPQSPEILAEKISGLLDNDELRLKMGKSAAARIQHYFNLEKMTSSFVELYNSNSLIKQASER